jgi:hypothetical protein
MRANGNTKTLRSVPSKTTIGCIKRCQFHMPNTFPRQESAVEGATHAGNQKMNLGYEPRPVFVNG